jgi:DNA-binding CsgD family transcriptional regulator
MEMIADPTSTLTPLQLEFVALYASGHDIRQIAEIKFYSLRGVQKSLTSARERVGANSLAHLCVLCLESGVIRKNGVGFKPVQEERVVGE